MTCLSFINISKNLVPRLYRGINFSFVIKRIFKIFKAYFSTSNEIQKVGMIIFVSGCLMTRGYV